MKKTFLSNFFALGVVLTVLFLVGIEESVSAQTQGDLYQIPQGSFATPSIALDRLNNALRDQKVTMGTNSSSSQAYQDAYNKMHYFEDIIRILMEEKATMSAQVGKSIVVGLDVFDQPHFAHVTLAQKLSYKNEAIDRLKA